MTPPMTRLTPPRIARSPFGACALALACAGLVTGQPPRRGAAHEAVSHHPPEARPDPKNCRYCGVRQLCDEYWTAETQRRMVQEGEDRRFGDVEVTVTGRHGPSSWDARVELSRDVPTGKSAVIRTSGDLELSPGDRLRVLGAAHIMDDEDQAQPAVITLGTLSEAYAVP